MDPSPGSLSFLARQELAATPFASPRRYVYATSSPTATKAICAGSVAMKVDQDIYRYARFIYTCDVCTTRFVVWMVPNKDWKTGVKAIKTKIDVNIGFGPKKSICKLCFEEFNPAPKYLSVDEYISLYIDEPTEETKAVLRDLWDLPPSLTPEEREENLEHIYGGANGYLQAWRARL